MFGRPKAGAVRVSVFGKTDLGRSREHNEDHFLVADLTRGDASLQEQVREHGVGDRGSLLVVADGMGGAAAGEVASEMATETIYDQLLKEWASDRDASPQRFARRLKEALEHANTQIHAYAKTHPDARGMGTTTTAVGILGQHLYLGQVGDSRAYLVRDGVAYQLTKDQSLMQRLIEAGELTEEEAARSDRRNIILQALGPEPKVRVDLTHQELRLGDTLVLCSDGLSGQVTKDEIARIVGEEPGVQAACDRLIALANERGGPDNITVVIARFGGDGLRAPAADDAVGHQVYPTIDTDATTDPALQSGGGGERSRRTMPTVQHGESRRPRRMLIVVALAVVAAVALYLLLPAR